MFSHRVEHKPGTKVILHWFLMAFNGGFINAGGFLATGRFVSHVTGFATLFGVDLVNQKIDAAIGILSVPVFFLVGAFIAGLLIDRPMHQGRMPHFDWVMGLCSFCLALSSLGNFLNFSEFGEAVQLGENYFLLALLCMASGLQNAAITSSSGSSVRTTHMTGLTTDLGLGIARLLTFDFSKEKYRAELYANKLRIGSIFSFVSGSAIGAYFFIKFGYFGFSVAALIAAYAAWHGARTKLSERNG